MLNIRMAPSQPTRAYMKRIQCGRYAYETDIAGVEVGDIAIVPMPTWLQELGQPATFTVKVTALTSDYTGPCVRVISIEKAANDNSQPSCV